MENKHIRGPWHLPHEDSPYWLGWHVPVSDANGAKVADISGPEPGRGDRARLIAAAPDLLAALDRLARAARNRDNHEGSPIRLIETKGELAEAERVARAAIARARGE